MVLTVAKEVLPTPPPTMNKVWHANHRMPAKPTMEQRVRWHLEHAEACTCRPIPRLVSEAIKEQRPAIVKSRRPRRPTNQT
jgi:hypothetical protein